MLALSFLFTASFYVKAQPPAQSATYQAIFGEQGAYGYFQINGNQIVANLHAGGSGEPLEGLTSVSYHIHEKWDSSGTWAMGSTDCGFAVTGNHWDPTYACGPASGDAQCNSQCIPKPSDGGSYACTYQNYVEDWTNCEVGDLSGKFGVISLSSGNGTRDVNDRYLLPVPENLSIVFHAPDGTRVLCGALLSSTEAPVAQQTIAAGKFYGNLGFARIQIDYDSFPYQVTTSFLGSTSQDNAAALAQIPDECKEPGAEISYHIHEMWAHTNAQGAIGGALCGSAYTGGHYDPTYACGPATGNPKCAVAECNWGTYDCTPTTYMQSPLACEMGDLSGKFGKLVLGQDGTATVQNTDQYLSNAPLVDLAVVFHCPGASRAFCVQLTTNDNVVTTALASSSPTPSVSTSPGASPSNSVSSGSSSSYGAPAGGFFMTVGLALLSLF